MPIGQKAVGDKIYVFSKNGGAQHGNACLILAHGCQAVLPGTRTFTVPANMTVRFFAQHGNLLTFDTRPSGVADFVPASWATHRCETGHTASCQETVSAGQTCHNYVLSKDVGYHNGGLPLYETLRHRNSGIQHGHSYADLVTEVSSMTIQHDIVSIRNRPFMAQPTLKSVIADLIANGYAYSTIYCGFCRSAASLPGLHGTATGSDHLGWTEAMA
ncbi:MAG: putative adhesin [Pseudomonadota bacterium]